MVILPLPVNTAKGEIMARSHVCNLERGVVKACLGSAKRFGPYLIRRVPVCESFFRIKSSSALGLCPSYQFCL
jgi:hypothetical protein